MSRVLVIGDSCIDIFEYGKVKRISPEAPVPILIPVEERQTSGMTLNVWANLWALGVNADVLTNSERPIKKRYVEENSNHMLLRVDRNDNVPPLDWSYLNNTQWELYDAVVISDYNKGFLDTEQISYILDNHKLTFLDSKKKFGEWADKAKFIKINDKEFHDNWDYFHEDRGDFGLVVTKGKDGVEYNLHKDFPLKIDAQHPVRDLSGAGDTFLAGLVAGFLPKFNIFEAIEYANKCAAWVVTQRGVTIIDPTKI